METNLLNAIELSRYNNILFRDPENEPDLSSEIENLKSEFPLGKGDLVTKILLQSPELKVVLIKMREETEITSFQKNRSVTFRILKGRINLHIRKGTLTLKEGESLVLYEKSDYTLESMEFTTLLMTLAS
jgi:mannose-6-phosphate isomerase-like protein (cupin superfamily)